MKKIIFLNYLFTFLYISANCQQAKLMLPIGHSNSLSSVQYSPNGKLVLTTSDNLGIIWDAQNGIVLTKLIASKNIISAFFSPDNKKVYLFSDNNAVQIWDIKTSNLIAEIGAKFLPPAFVIRHEYWGDISFLNNLIAIPINNSLKFWDASNGKLIDSIKDEKNTINYVKFSPNGQKFLTNSFNGNIKVWDLKSKKVLFNIPKKDTSSELYANFSPDGKKILLSKLGEEGLDIIISTSIYDSNNGRFVSVIKNKTKDTYPEPFNGSLRTIEFTKNSKTIISASNNLINIWDVNTGKLVDSLKGNIETQIISSIDISNNGSRILAAFNINKVYLWDVPTHKVIVEFDTKGTENPDLLPLVNFRYAKLSPNDKNIIVTCTDFSGKIYDINKGILDQTLKSHTSSIGNIKLSFDKKQFFTRIGTFDKLYIQKWDIKSGKPLNNMDSLSNLKLKNFSYLNYYDMYSDFSEDGRFSIRTRPTNPNTLEIINRLNGKVLNVLEGHTQTIRGAAFSSFGDIVITYSSDKTAKIWDVFTGKLLNNLTGHSNEVIGAGFSPNGKIAYTLTTSDNARLWDVKSGKLIAELLDQHNGSRPAKFTLDSKKIITSAFLGKFATIWNTADGTRLHDLIGHNGEVVSINISNDGKKIITTSEDNSAKIWDIETGSQLTNLIGHVNTVTSAAFLPDDKKIVTTSDDGTAKLWNAETGKLLYTFFAVDSTDYLVTDPYGRYDGTEGARKLLYFTCGTEVIGLDQVKDQLWVPNLAERIMKGDSINAKKLSDLDICGLIPQVEKEDKTGYHFIITPQRGGLGETVLYVNDIEVKRYNTTQLLKTGTGYELNVTDKELQPYFIAGQENPVTVKAYTAKNDISSRGAKIIQDETKKQAVAPNLYAVMIGVSDYKGAELQLKYAAKDASDISDAIKSAANKLLGNEHVFTYNMTTGTNHYQLPEKIAIKNVLQEIGKKANANDILMIFFAGHGVTSGEKKQFYFLTADASQASATDAPEQVGISTAELSEWMKPANIKAQKRILILDACNSGQAINELVKVGNTDQNYLAARNDDKAEQIKAIDKLNEKSGLFILAASASNQSAYEMGRYSQGLLTYALLKAIKQQPDILEDNKYLNLNRWFIAAEKTVSDMVRETGNRQEPQIVSAGNFNVGLVDQEVMAGIKLANEKALFTFSNLQNNDPDISADDLHINRLLDNQLNEISTRGDNSSISYIPGSKSMDAYSIGGRYNLNGGDITVKVNIRQNDITKFKFELSSKKDDLKIIVEELVKQVSEWILKNK